MRLEVGDEAGMITRVSGRKTLSLVIISWGPRWVKVNLERLRWDGNRRVVSRQVHISIFAFYETQLTICRWLSSSFAAIVSAQTLQDWPRSTVKSQSSAQ